MEPEVMHTQLICNEVFAIVNGILCEYERVCEEHIEEPDDP